jgi:hypothetical protein
VIDGFVFHRFTSTLVVATLVAFVAYYGYLGYLETRVYTPLPADKVRDLMDSLRRKAVK